MYQPNPKLEQLRAQQARGHKQSENSKKEGAVAK